MKFIKAIQESMDLIAAQKDSVFIGYNVKYGKAGNTILNAMDSQLIETPVAENLMLSMAIGMSIEGFIPIVYFERFDFILNAMDSIINHLDKIKNLSHGEYAPKIIIRAVIGNERKPLYTGITHTQDFTENMKGLVSFPVIKPTTPSELLETYKKAIVSTESYLIVEEKDRYEEE